jgi:thioredoxin:protein disulfide reductase
MISASSFDPSFPAGGAAVYAWAFGQGVLVDLTPCVYPLIPITVAVFGAKGVSRGRALFLATAYVLGMAALYTGLGVLVALSGGQFGAWLANPWVVVPIAALLVALATSMFGAFDLQLPTSLQSRLNSVGGAGPVGAFLMGLVSGFISAPCTGPVLLSLLAYIAKASAEGSSVMYGASLLFVYALGMGTLFFAVALGASLFRPGPWMEHVKSFFGVALIVMALWFLGPIVPALAEWIVDPDWGLWLGLGLAALGLALGAVHLSFYGPPAEKLRKGVMVVVAVVGAQLTVNNILYVPPADWHEVETLDELEAALARAQAADKPVLIDFAASWCLPCKELDVQTFHHPDVEPLLAQQFHLVKIDVTDPTEDQMIMQSGFRSGTLPSVLIYPAGFDPGALMGALRAGDEAPQAAVQFKTFVDAEAFLAEIRDVL